MATMSDHGSTPGSTPVDDGRPIPVDLSFDSSGFSGILHVSDDTLQKVLNTIDLTPLGVKGDPGVPGADGKDGKDGANGTTGADGTAGVAGAKGDKGDPGSTTGSIGITIDGGGAAILTGLKGYITVPYSCTITGWRITGLPAASSIVVDVWKKAGAIPTVKSTEHKETDGTA